jgi:hypothetical protein
MNTKNISWDKLSFKMAENYEEFSISLLNLNYSYEDDDFLAFAELHGDLDIVGYAIVWGSNNEAKDITATYSVSQFNTAKKEYVEIIRDYI